MKTKREKTTAREVKRTMEYLKRLREWHKANPGKEGVGPGKVTTYARIRPDWERESRPPPPMRDCVVTFERPDGTCHEVIVKASHGIHRRILIKASDTKNTFTHDENEDAVVILDDRGNEIAIPGMKHGDRIIGFQPIKRM